MSALGLGGGGGGLGEVGGCLLGGRASSKGRRAFVDGGPQLWRGSVRPCHGTGPLL